MCLYSVQQTSYFKPGECESTAQHGKEVLGTSWGHESEVRAHMIFVIKKQRAMEVSAQPASSSLFDLDPQFREWCQLHARIFSHLSSTSLITGILTGLSTR